MADIGKPDREQSIADKLEQAPTRFVLLFGDHLSRFLFTGLKGSFIVLPSHDSTP
jgi:hypothetical protein